jgi:hypothetical protein
MDKLTNPISDITYALPSKKFVWFIHIVIGIFLMAVGAVYLSYKDKDEKDIPINLTMMNQAVYIIILILGAVMFMWQFMWHFHLLGAEQGWLRKVFGE